MSRAKLVNFNEKNWSNLQKEGNSTALINTLVANYYYKASQEEEKDKSELEVIQKEREAQEARIRLTAIEFCRDYLFGLFECSKELAIVMAEEWTDNMSKFNENNIHSWAIAKGLSERNAEQTL